MPCYPGSFCASVGLSSPTGPCTEGFYCPANFSSVSPTAFLCPKVLLSDSWAVKEVGLGSGQDVFVFHSTKGHTGLIEKLITSTGKVALGFDNSGIHPLHRP